MQGYLNQKLLGIRQPEPARRMERLGDLRHIAGGTDAERHAETNDHEVRTGQPVTAQITCLLRITARPLRL
jgi:hypothetical protein